MSNLSLWWIILSVSLLSSNYNRPNNEIATIIKINMFDNIVELCLAAL